MAAIEEQELTLDGVRVFYRRVAGEGTPTRLLPRQPVPRRGLAALHGARRALDRDRHAGLGTLRHRPTRIASTTRCTGSRPSSSAASTSSASPSASSSSTTGACLALIGAQRRPQLVEKLVIINAVPLTPGYRWHWIAQLWRRRPVGEILNATGDPLGAGPGAAPGARRSQPDAAGVRRHDLEAPEEGDRPRRSSTSTGTPTPTGWPRPAGTSAGSPAPRWSLWGERDPYLSTKFAQAFADALPDSEMDLVAGAGHWPWIDDARVIDRVVDFVA